MHTSFKKLLAKSTILRGGVFCIVLSLFLTSCDNFLKAADIKDEIEKVIEYNNAQLVNVLIHSEERIGSFLLEGEKEFKINHTVAEVQFTANSKVCIFKGLEAVSKTDTSISRNDCVEIKKISGDIVTGVYTYSIKVTQKQNDILIRPVYQLRPSVISISPLYTNDPTEPIVITFDTPMEDIDIKPENSVFDFTNISIKCDNANISDKFNTPIFNEDKTVLTITPISNEFNALLHSKNSSTYTDINISFDPRNIFKIDDNYLRFAEDNALDFVVHYCTDFEAIAPVEISNSFAVYKNWRTSDNTGSSKFTLRYADFVEDNEVWDDENETTPYISDFEFSDHITGEYVYIYGKYDGTGSPIRTIEVKEYYDAELNCYGDSETCTITKEYTKNSDEVILWNRYSDDTIAFCIKKKLLSDDGIIILRTIVKDTYGNSAEQKEVAVIKSTSITSLDDAALINVPTIKFLYEDEPVTFNMTEYENELRDIKLIYYDYKTENYDINESLISENDPFMPLYGYRYINPTWVYKSIKCKLYKNNQELTTEPVNMTKQAYTGTYADAIKWHYYIDEDLVEDLTDLTVRVFIEDNVGNTTYKDYTFPGKTILVSDEKINSSTRRIIKFPENDETRKAGLIVFKNNNTWKTKYCSYNTIDLNISYIPDGTEFYLLSADYSDLCSTLGKKYIAGTTESETHSIGYDKISYEKAEDENTRINIRIKDSSLNYFDTIFVKFGTLQTSFNYLTTYYLQEGQKNITISTYTSFLYSHEHQLFLYGVKNGVCSSIGPITIEKLTDPKYDNSKPKIDWFGKNVRFPEYYYFSLRDEESGISKISFNGKSIDYTEVSDGNTYAYALNLKNDKLSLQPIQCNDVAGQSYDGAILINYYDIIDYSIGVPWLKFEIKVYDKANNVTTKTINELLPQHNPPVYYSNNGSYWTFKINESDGNYQSFGISKFEDNTWAYVWYSRGKQTVSLTVPTYRFIRTYNYNSIPKYYWTGTTPPNHSKTNDSLALIGSSSQMQVSSKHPVLVQTIVSPCQFAICKDWTKDEWLYYKKIIGEEVFDLNAGNLIANYTIPLDEINSNECYVVVVHFADGSSIMSDVMVKE